MYRARRRNTTFPVRKRRPSYATGRNLGTLPSSRGYVPYYGTRRRRNTSTRAVEMKFDDSTISAFANVQSPPHFVFAPTLGSGATQRIGRKVLVRKIFIRGTAYLEQSRHLDAQADQGVYSASPQKLRMILFWDMQPNGVAANTSDILAYNPMSPNIDAMINLDYRDRFKVIKDKTFVFDACYARVDANDESPSAVAFNRTIYSIKVFKRCKVPVIFNAGTTGGIADVSTGALYVLFLGSGNNANPSGILSDSILVNYKIRVRYEDP